MATYYKENPVGLDSVIQYAMAELTKLGTLWNAEVDVYPRCYQKATEGYNRIEWYKGDGNYELLNIAEGNKFFFMAENDLVQVGNGYFTTTISLYCVLNLKKVLPDVPHRADAEAWNDVMGAINKIAYFGQADRIVTGFDRVFGRYDYEQQNDMQPYHCFRIDIPVLEFKLNDIYCN